MKILREFSQSLLILLVGISLVNCSGGTNCDFGGADRPVRRADSALPPCPNGGGGGGNNNCSTTQTPTDALFSMGATGTFLIFDISSSNPPLVQICNNVSGTLGGLAVSQPVGGGAAFIYVLDVNGATSTIGAYSIAGGSSAALTAVQGQPFGISSDTLTTNDTIRTDPNGDYVLVTNQVTGKIHVFLVDRVNAATLGALTEVAGSPFSSPNVSSIAVDFSGQFAYATDPVDGQITIYTITVPTPGVLALANINPNPMPITTGAGDFPNHAHSSVTNPGGVGTELLYTANTSSVTAYSVNEGGSLTALAPPYEDANTDGLLPVRIAIDASSMALYVMSSNTKGLLAYQMSGTGQLTLVVGSPFLPGTGVNDITIRGETLYVQEGAGGGFGGTIDPFAINTTNNIGVITAIAQVAPAPFTTSANIVTAITQ